MPRPGSESGPLPLLRAALGLALPLLLSACGSPPPPVASPVVAAPPPPPGTPRIAVSCAEAAKLLTDFAAADPPAPPSLSPSLDDGRNQVEADARRSARVADLFDGIAGKSAELETHLAACRSTMRDVAKNGLDAVAEMEHAETAKAALKSVGEQLIHVDLPALERVCLAAPQGTCNDFVHVLSRVPSNVTTIAHLDAHARVLDQARPLAAAIADPPSKRAAEQALHRLDDMNAKGRAALGVSKRLGELRDEAAPKHLLARAALEQLTSFCRRPE